MGRRARGQGITNAALRVARAAAMERDEQCADIARNVYNVARELKLIRDVDALPLRVSAPLQAAAEQVAIGTAKMAGLDYRDEAVVLDVAAYLIAGFREMAVVFNVEHFNEWRRTTDSVLSSPTSTTTEEGRTHGASRDGDRPTDDADEVSQSADGGTAQGERSADGTS